MFGKVGKGVAGFVKEKTYDKLKTNIMEKVKEDSSEEGLDEEEKRYKILDRDQRREEHYEEMMNLDGNGVDSRRINLRREHILQRAQTRILLHNSS